MESGMIQQKIYSSRNYVVSYVVNYVAMIL